LDDEKAAFNMNRFENMGLIKKCDELVFFDFDMIIFYD
jgi:hypothetical protein